MVSCRVQITWELFLLGCSLPRAKCLIYRQAIIVASGRRKVCLRNKKFKRKSTSKSFSTSPSRLIRFIWPQCKFYQQTMRDRQKPTWYCKKQNKDSFALIFIIFIWTCILYKLFVKINLLLTLVRVPIFIALLYLKIQFYSRPTTVASDKSQVATDKNVLRFFTARNLSLHLNTEDQISLSDSLLCFRLLYIVVLDCEKPLRYCFRLLTISEFKFYFIDETDAWVAAGELWKARRFSKEYRIKLPNILF